MFIFSSALRQHVSTGQWASSILHSIPNGLMPIGILSIEEEPRENLAQKELSQIQN